MLGWHWRPGMFMPRRFSRITLEITDVRVERLQDISEGDALAEGTADLPNPCGYADTDHFACCAKYPHSNRERFAALWDSINGKRPGCSWADNPWVWAISFRRIDASSSVFNLK